MTTLQIPTGLTFPSLRGGMPDVLSAVNKRLRDFDPNHVDLGEGDDNPYFNFVSNWSSAGVSWTRALDMSQLALSSPLPQADHLEDDEIAAWVNALGDIEMLPRYAEFGQEAYLDYDVPEQFPNRYQDPPTNTVPHTWRTWIAQGGASTTYPEQIGNKWYTSLQDFSQGAGAPWLFASAWWFASTQNQPPFRTLNSQTFREIREANNPGP